MEKDVKKEHNICSLHKRGMAPVPVILYEAFGEDGLSICNPEKYSPAELGKMVKCFEDLIGQGYIEKIDTPFERCLKKTINKAKEKADFPAEVHSILFKEEKTLRNIDFEKPPLAGLKNYPIVDENDLVVFLQTKEMLSEILKTANVNTGFSPEQTWKSTIDSTKEWWTEYEDYKVYHLGYDSSEGLIMGSFHTLLWNTHHKEWGDFMRSWYKLSV